MADISLGAVRYVREGCHFKPSHCDRKCGQATYKCTSSDDIQDGIRRPGSAVAHN